MRSLPGFCQRALFALLAAVPLLVAGPRDVVAADYDRPPASATTYIRDLQTALQRIGCYAPPLVVDGKFFGGSVRAVDKFIRLRFAPSGQVPANLQNQASFLAAVRAAPAGFCDSSPQPPGVRPVCDKPQVEQAWLDLNPKVKNLKVALDDLGGQLDQLFSPTAVGQSYQETTTRLIGAKDIFLAGKLRISNLVETEALLGKSASAACRTCVALSDFATLKRLADPTNGILYHTTAKDPAGAPLKLDVNKLDSTFVGRARVNVQRIRAYIALIQNDPLGSDEPSKRLKDEVNALVTAYQGRSFGIPIAGNMLNYSCPGFEGF